MNAETARIVQEAAHWFVILEGAGPAKRAAFVRWLLASNRHAEEYLAITRMWWKFGALVGPGLSRLH